MKDAPQPNKSWLPWKEEPDTEIATRPLFERSYVAVTATLSREIRALIEDSQAQYDALLDLEQSLTTIQNLILDEHLVEDTSREQLLKSVWTALGGNRQNYAEHEDNIQILTILVQVTQQATTNIRNALLVLEGVEDGLKELRTRTVVPSLLDGSDPTHVQLSLQQQIELVEDGVRALEDSRKRSLERAKDSFISGKAAVEGNQWVGQYISQRAGTKRI